MPGGTSRYSLRISLSLFIEWLGPQLPQHIAHYLAPFANRTGIVFWTCVLTAIVVSKLTKPEPEERLKGMIWNIQSLSLPKEQRAQMRGLRNPMIWYAVVAAMLIALYVRFH